jgi:hypothetical protein
MYDILNLSLNKNFINEIINHLPTDKKDCVNGIINFENENLSSLLNTRLLFVIKEILSSNSNISFDTSFNYITYSNEGFKENIDNQVSNYSSEYKLLIGLTEIKYYQGGNIVLWSPINDQNKNEINDLHYSEDYYVLSNIFRKYNIGFYNKENLYEKREKLKDKSYNCIPNFFKILNEGNALLFSSEKFITGNPFPKYDQNNELLLINVIKKSLVNNPIKNLVNKIKLYDYIQRNNSFEIPFQVIKCEGEYNDKKFINQYIRYWNFDNCIEINKKISDLKMIDKLKITLLEIFNNIRQSLNTKYREIILESQSLNYSIKFNNYFEKHLEDCKLIQKIDIKNNFDEAVQCIENYVNNVGIKFKNEVINYLEEINNTWEENGCSFKDEIYQENSFLKSTVYIKFGLYKI